MSRLLHPVIAAAVAVTVTSVGLSPVTAAAEDVPGRFTMTPTDGGFIRLDTQTGAMAMCSGKEGTWACRAMPDDQKMLQEKIARLEEQNRELKEENRRLEDVMGLNPDKPADGANPPQDSPQGSPKEGFKLPSEKDVDQAFDYLEGMLKKFRDRLKKLEEEEKHDGGVPL